MPTAKSASPDEFWKKERVDLAQRNIDLSAEFERSLPEIRRREAHRTSILVSCMDERAGFIEDSLDLLPGEAIVMAAAGGRIAAEEFDRLYGLKVRHAVQARRQAVIFLTAHRCASRPDLGCRVFSGDPLAQSRHLLDLRSELVRLYPEAYIHALTLDTGTVRLVPEETDRRDDRLVQVLTAPANLLGADPERLEHGGYGIYVGDAYRFWVAEPNRYMRLSPLNPNLGEDILLAIRILREESVSDFGSRPICLQADSPIYPDPALTGACRRNMERKIAEALADPAVREMAADGSVRLIKTETEMVSHRGFAVG